MYISIFLDNYTNKSMILYIIKSNIVKFFFKADSSSNKPLDSFAKKMYHLLVVAVGLSSGQMLVKCQKIIIINDGVPGWPRGSTYAASLSSPIIILWPR